MNEYKLLTDSTCDLPLEILKKFEIEAIPFSYQFGDEPASFDCIDENREKRLRAFYRRIKNGEFSSTSQINPSSFIKFFEPFLQNEKDILFISFSSGLSSSYGSAIMAANQLKTKYKDRKIRIIDSLCASLGEGLLVYESALLKDKGMDIESLSQWIENNKLKIKHPNIIGSLKHLQRGGRISSATAFFGSLLNIMPILHMTKQGKLEIVDKKRGMKNSVNFIISKMKESNIGNKIFISHSDCKKQALEIADIMKKEFNSEILVNEIGTVIGSHTGCGTIAIFYHVS